METAVLNLKGEEIGKCELPVKVFEEKPNPYFLHEVITAYLSNQRSGTASTKTRSEVSGGGRKPWKEKGTGRARAGSIRSPLWKKGGVVFGPRPHSFRKGMPAAKRRQALAQALQLKFSEGNIVVIDTIEISEAKTRFLLDILRRLNISAPTRVLVVSRQMNENWRRASRNLQGFSHSLPSDLNAYMVLNSKKVIFTKDALENIGTF